MTQQMTFDFEGRTLMDIETGEVFEGTVLNEAMDKQVFEQVKANEEARSRQKEGFKKKLALEDELLEKRYKQSKADNNFINSYMDAVEKMNKLNINQKGYLVVLACYLEYKEKGCRLLHSNGKPLSTKNIMNILHIKSTAFKQFKKVCDENHILWYDKEAKAYCMNNFIFFKGGFKMDKHRIVSYDSDYFKKALDELKPCQIGALVEIQKYIHYKTHELCKNPNEPNIDEIRLMTNKDLADALGITVKQLSRYLTGSIVDGKYLIMKMVLGKNAKYVMNPNFVFRTGQIVAKEIVFKDGSIEADTKDLNDIYFRKPKY